MNELYWLLTLLVSFIGILLFYKFFGKVGLFIWLSIATIVANIQTAKLVNLFGVETALGTILYGTTFLATDILNEKYGKKEARKSIYFGFASMLMMTILMCVALLYKPSPNDFASESLNVIFVLNFRITIASIVAFVASQFCDTWLYNKIKEKFNGLWVRNNVSTVISQLIDTVLFVSITYGGNVPLEVLLQIGLSMYIFKFIIALFDTPFMYIAVKLKCKEY